MAGDCTSIFKPPRKEQYQITAGMFLVTTAFLQDHQFRKTIKKGKAWQLS
jgi:hypothetical protein